MSKINLEDFFVGFIEDVAGSTRTSFYHKDRRKFIGKSWNLNIQPNSEKYNNYRKKFDLTSEEINWLVEFEYNCELYFSSKNNTDLNELSYETTINLVNYKKS